ncbi:hypothetical protein [Streptomyces uncialis]|uniref:hypothetical protein n=1 Tax=Streptomyces uncialis TaxID=1048205 RepID=UPI003867E048|nr:hypothetical protein OG268_31760 [Streptomyces uncialis]
MARPSRYPLELRRRAVRVFAEVRGDCPNESAALRAVAQKPGIGSAEAPRNRVKRDEVDSGQRPAAPTVTLSYYAHFLPEAGARGRTVIDGVLGSRRE